MSRAHLPGLTIQEDGTVEIRNQADLDELLACPVHDLSSEMVVIADRHWQDRGEVERTRMAAFLNSTRQQIIGEGRLPRPRTELPSVGTRVESVVVSRSPGPRSRYGTGTVVGHDWMSMNGGWAVNTTFDQPAGLHFGMPINGTVCPPDFVHVLGGPGRAWSSMTPAEIDQYLDRYRADGAGVRQGGART